MLKLAGSRVAAGSATLDLAGAVQTRVKPTPAGRQKLARAGGRTATLVARARDAAGNTATKTAAVVLRR